MTSKSAVLIIAAVLSWPDVARAQDYCECINGILYCYDASTPSYDDTPYAQAETPSYYFPYDGSGSRQTQNFAPTYTAPSHASYASGDPALPPELLLLGLIGLIAVVIAAACSSSATTIEDDIEETRALADKLEADAREADQRIAAYLEKMRGEHGDG